MLEKFLDLPVKARAVVFGIVAVFLLALAMFATSGDSGSGEDPEPESTAAADRSDVPSREEIDATVKGAQVPQSVEGGEGIGELSLPQSTVSIQQAATRARDFTEAYMSLRFDQTAAAWQDGVLPYLSSDSSVDVFSTVPTGPASEGFISSQQVTTAKATVNRVQMVADSFITFEVSVTTTTTTLDEPTYAGTSTYLIAMSEEGDWKVNQVALIDMQDPTTTEN